MRCEEVTGQFSYSQIEIVFSMFYAVVHFISHSAWVILDEEGSNAKDFGAK